MTEPPPKKPPAARAERAAAAEAELAERYPALARADLERLAAGLVALRAGDDDAAARRTLTDAAHDLKGQGATFGYPLAGRVAGLLCRYLEGTSPVDPAVVGAHLEALEQIVRHRIAGAGGPLGQDLLCRLESLVAAGRKSR